MAEHIPEIKIISNKKIPLMKGKPFQIDWIDVISYEAHSPTRKTDKISFPGSTEKFETGVIENLTEEIRLLTEEEQNPKNIYRYLIFKYHPDFYGKTDVDTQKLATEYSQTLQHMYETRYFEKVISNRTV